MEQRKGSLHIAHDDKEGEEERSNSRAGARIMRI